jgi:segregation and condensation protein B
MSENKQTENDIFNAVRDLARQKQNYDLVDRAEIAAKEIHDIDRKVEALLFASPIPLRAQDIAQRLGEHNDIGGALARLKRFYTGRGVNLCEIAGGWRFQTANDIAQILEEQKEETKKLSRAALETLAIIAYHQPCTRAEIEDIRGVSFSRGTLDLLMDIKWVRPAGRRRSVGKPLTYKTTPEFLAHFNLANLDDLPTKLELQSQGLLSANLPKDFEVPRPHQNLMNEELNDNAQNDANDADFVQDFFE